MVTPVIFKKERNSILAVFPAMAGSDKYYSDCGAYAPIGQHVQTCLNYAASLKPAKPEEYEGLKRELESIGYNDLKIVKKFTQAHFEERKKQCQHI